MSACLPGVQQRNATLRRKRVRAEKIALYAIYVQISSMILKEGGRVAEWERKQLRWGAVFNAVIENAIIIAR